MVDLDMAIEKLYSQKEINERISLIREKEKKSREEALARKIAKQKARKELEDSGLARAIITKYPREPTPEPVIEDKPKKKVKAPKKDEEPIIEEQLEVITEVKAIVNDKKAELEAKIAELAKLKAEIEEENVPVPDSKEEE